MKQPRDGAVVTAGLSMLLGCDSEQTAVSQRARPAGYVVPPSTENLPQVDHPEYIHWSQFPVGASVVRKKEVSNDHGTVRVTTTVRLAVKTDQKVVVETQVTVERSEEDRVENPPFSAEFSATFALPSGMKLEQFSLPSLKAKQINSERRQACRREFESQVFVWEENNESGPMAVKLWRCNDVPGRMLRQEIDGHMHHSVEDIIAITIPQT